VACSLRPFPPSDTRRRRRTGGAANTGAPALGRPPVGVAPASRGRHGSAAADRTTPQAEAHPGGRPGRALVPPRYLRPIPTKALVCPDSATLASRMPAGAAEARWRARYRPTTTRAECGREPLEFDGQHEPSAALLPNGFKLSGARPRDARCATTRGRVPVPKPRDAVEAVYAVTIH
jgi:hypothetical protein